jgi:hypothetical protein
MYTIPEPPAHLAAESLHIGPNLVHAYIVHGVARDGWRKGEVEDLGWTKNVMTTASNGGRDMIAAMIAGQAGFGVTSTIATASSSTSITATSTPFVASAYIGQIVVAEETTAAPVWGVIVSNTTSVLTIDGWKYGDGTAGTTPGSTANYNILPGAAPYRYIALTENASAASASSTALTGEITTGARDVCPHPRAGDGHAVQDVQRLGHLPGHPPHGPVPAVHRVVLGPRLRDGPERGRQRRLG